MSSSTPHPEIISMEFSTGCRDNCYYRILAGRHAHIYRATPKDEPEATFSQGKLASVDTVWHPTMINFMALRKTERLTLLAEEAVWQREPHAPQLIIAKMTRFFWEILYIEAETAIFEHLAALNIGPKFLGHVHENGRVIGFALEKLLD
ncbi:alpha-galactosidase A [Akanthomyces lecanii RCEF 1005]|uniref:Alpha-galactosidase A n=1 Tax=Akanthomyces lecanii RCEF 1005 TaxID=1081108 RepID=A0A168AV44_CORDF|nr:alpha-galactosidase A [Akanthomyces lecanii RCEF 1005]